MGWVRLGLDRQGRLEALRVPAQPAALSISPRVDDWRAMWLLDHAQRAEERGFPPGTRAAGGSEESVRVGAGNPPKCVLPDTPAPPICRQDPEISATFPIYEEAEKKEANVWERVGHAR
jgi:hypothetical protein